MRKILPALIFALIFCSLAFGQDSKCPTISVNGPSSVVQPGEVMTFTANVSDVDLTKIRFKWTVTGTMILGDQHSQLINVDTSEILDKPITATVEIYGLPDGCNNSASETGIITSACVLPITLDEFGKLSKNDVRTRLFALVVEMREKPSDIAYIILYHPSKNKKSYKNRVAQIKNFLIKDNKVPAEMLVIVFGGEEPEERTRIFLVPPGAEPPTP